MTYKLLSNGRGVAKIQKAGFGLREANPLDNRKETKIRKEQKNKTYFHKNNLIK